MSDIVIKLDMRGLEDLIKTAPDQVDAAVRSAAFGVQALAQMASPVLTGANRSSIYTKTSQGINGSPGSLGDVLPDVGKLEAVVGPSMEYSARLEFGFIGTDSLGRSCHQAARPYLTPAAEQAGMLFGRFIRLVAKR